MLPSAKLKQIATCYKLVPSKAHLYNDMTSMCFHNLAIKTTVTVDLPMVQKRIPKRLTWLKLF